MIKIAVSGAAGRMGRTVYKTLIGSEDFTIVFGVDAFPASDLPYPVYRSFSDVPLDCDVVLDFSSASALDDVLNYVAERKVKLVLAATGHTEEQLKRLYYASRHTAIFKSSNMSLGINLLLNLSKEAAKFLGEAYDVEIVETHHNIKKDAPSGTALSLAEAVNEVRNNTLVPTFGRRESSKQRGKDEIGIHSVRGGTVVGKHDVMFLGAGEVVKLSHEAESKEVFVRGALRAAAFLADKVSGLYDMNSILGKFYAVTSVSTESDVSLVTLPSVSMDMLLTLLAKIKERDINLDMISENRSADGVLSVSFTLSDRDLPVVESLMNDFSAEHRSVMGTAKLTAEGAGMEHTSGVALDVLSILRGLGAEIFATTTSETKISCCISKEALKPAEEAIKKYYGI